MGKKCVSTEVCPLHLWTSDFARREETLTENKMRGPHVLLPLM